MMNLNEVLQATRARYPYLAFAESAPTGVGWVACTDVISDPTLLRAGIDAMAEGRGTTKTRVAASLFAQDYSFRVASIALAAYALDLPAPSTLPDSLAVRVSPTGQAELAVLNPSCQAIDAAGLVSCLFERHLEPFIGAVRSTVRVGERLLWANAAAAMAWTFRGVNAAGPHGDPKVRKRAMEFFDRAAPWIGGYGTFTTIETPESTGWYWNRTSCCLWYQTTTGSYCSDCSKHDPTTLDTARRAAISSADPK